ncbi:MAG TPA: DNA-binding protein [Balneola sp.]|nr:DNA-binding protein [Balneola sp.]|tara:strand:+ start:358 stop:549 length:192 start_codon:yes stop_codon:yes gene_type:complete
MNDEKKFITAKELAVRWKRSPRTLANQRLAGVGCPYYKISGKVLYDLADVENIEEKNFVSRND